MELTAAPIIHMLRSNVAFRLRQKHNRHRTSKPIKLNTAKLNTISHRESAEQEMDRASSNGRRRKLNPRQGTDSYAADRVQHSQDISWQARQKTPGLVRLQRPGATDSYEQKIPRECCTPGALDPPLQRIKMPADSYKSTPVH